MIRRQFDTLYREGAESGRVMAICLHPFVIGVPHRIGALDSALAYVLRHEGVWRDGKRDRRALSPLAYNRLDGRVREVLPARAGDRRRRRPARGLRRSPLGARSRAVLAPTGESALQQLGRERWLEESDADPEPRRHFC
jgi:hypothetical protein